MEFRDRSQVNQRGSRHAEESGRIEALFEFVQRRIHPVLACVADQASESVLRSEVEHARFADDDVSASVFHQEAAQVTSRSAAGLVELILVANRPELTDPLQCL